MAKFIIYNIQLLPENSAQEVGVSGYRRLFSLLRDVNSRYFKAKKQTEFHYQMSPDTYLGPLDFRFPSGLVYGHFVRYRKTDKVTELATGKSLYSSKGNTVGVTSSMNVPFVFDTERHLFAIAHSSSMPKPILLLEILEQFLRPISEENFPEHTLSINLVSRANALEAVFTNAVAYKVVNVNLVAPNGHEAEDILREMRDSKTQTVAVQASGGREGRMIEIPAFIKTILRAATGHGSIKLTYFVNDGGDKTRKEKYDSSEAPKTFALKHSKLDASEEDFLARVGSKLHSIDISDPADDESAETED